MKCEFGFTLLGLVSYCNWLYGV